MPELDVIPIESVDLRPDPYLSVRCGVCGIEWAAHHWFDFVFVVRSRPSRLSTDPMNELRGPSHPYPDPELDGSKSHIKGIHDRGGE
jgi:hypothetical protein